MATDISADLPNPDCTVESNWDAWDQFITAHGVALATEIVVRRYQNLEQSGAQLLDANWLNHYLNLQEHGAKSRYADLAVNEFDLEAPEPDFYETLSALDGVFACNSYRFSSGSVVYKGVHLAPYYEVHEFDKIQPGAQVTFPGFISVSVCRDKALDFAGKNGVLLVISGLDRVDAIVPANSHIQTTRRAHIPEQEVILNRNTTLLVKKAVNVAGAQGLREVHLQVL